MVARCAAILRSASASAFCSAMADAVIMPPMPVAAIVVAPSNLFFRDCSLVCAAVYSCSSLTTLLYKLMYSVLETVLYSPRYGLSISGSIIQSVANANTGVVNINNVIIRCFIVNLFCLINCCCVI